MGKKTPDAPDYEAAAEKTAESSREMLEQQTYANRVNQTTPWGTSTWNNQMVWDPATKQNLNKWTQNETLNSDLQGALDSQTELTRAKSDLAGGMLGRMAGEYGPAMNWDQFGDVEGMDWSKYGKPQDFDLSKYGNMQGTKVSDYGKAQNVDTTKYGNQQGVDMSRFGSAQNAQAQGRARDVSMGQFGRARDAQAQGRARDVNMGMFGNATNVNVGDYGSQMGLGRNPMELRNRAEDAAYKRSTNRLDPQFAEQKQALEVKLRNQGLRPGDQAWDAAIGNMGQRENDAYEQARLGATGEGRTESQQMYNQQMGTSDFYNNLRSERVGEAFQEAGFNNQNRNERVNDAFRSAELANQNRTERTADEFNAANMANQNRTERVNDAFRSAEMANQNRTERTADDFNAANMANQNRNDAMDREFQQSDFYNQMRGERINEGFQQADFNNQNRDAALDRGFQEAAQTNQNRATAVNEGFQQNQLQNALRTQGMSEGLQANQYANQQRQQQIQEEMTRRGFSLNEINALLTGQQVQNPQFQSYNTAGVAPGVDYTGAAMNQSNFDQMMAQQQNAGIGSAIGTGIGAAAQFGMFSDRRLKRNIKQIGVYLGYPVYLFEYLWGAVAVGVMSDEVNQDAVFKHHTGYDIVDYSKIQEA